MVIKIFVLSITEWPFYTVYHDVVVLKDVTNSAFESRLFDFKWMENNIIFPRKAGNNK